MHEFQVYWHAVDGKKELKATITNYVVAHRLHNSSMYRCDEDSYTRKFGCLKSFKNHISWIVIKHLEFWRGCRDYYQVSFLSHSCFIQTFQRVSDIELTLIFKRNKYQVLKMIMQPVPIFVGEKTTHITKAFVSTIFCGRLSPHSGRLTCFKLYHAFDAKYPPEP